MVRFLFLVLLVAAVPARAEFVLSNLRMTLYHEVGHAVIDQHEVALFGPEETAADTFAMVLADRLHAKAELRRLITDMTVLSRIEAQSRFFDAWDEYMPKAQRLAYAICLYYGLNPQARGQTARVLGMPPDRARECEDRGAVVRVAWTPILDRIAPAVPTQSLRPAATGKALRLLGKDINRVNRHLSLPRAIPVTYEACGEDNAYYYHWDERIVFCSEMVEALRGHAADQ